MLENPALVCFDLPCLVVPTPGTADEAFDRALRRLGLDPDAALHRRARTCRLAWPGVATRVALLEVFGSEVWSQAAAAAYDDAFGASVARRGAGIADGATAVLAQLRSRGAHIVLTTEFSASTREAVLDVLDWTALVAMLVSEGTDADLGASAVEAALHRTGVDPAQVVVVSSTASGVAVGRKAEVGCVVGIPGADVTAAELRAAGATCLSTLPQLAAGLAAPRLVPA